MADRDAAAAQRQQRIEELGGAAVRAQTGDAALHFRGGRLFDAEHPFPATAPHLRRQDDSLATMRGVADALALRRQHSDPDVHARYRPEPPIAAAVFECLEQLRVESLADLPGVRTNLAGRHRRWSQEVLSSGDTETRVGMLLYALVQFCRSRITGEPLTEDTEDRIESARFELAPLVGRALAGLRRAREDQQRFAELAAAIARAVDGLVAEELERSGDGGGRSRALAALAFLADPADDGPESGSTPGGRLVPSHGAADYHVYTRRYDREITASELIRPAWLAELRAQLDQRVARQAVNVPRLAERLRAVLAHPEDDDWESGHEEGRIDGRRLAQLVTSPAERRLFRIRTEQPVTDVAVTFLVDCSGSMRRHRETVAMLLDVMARALDLAGATTELLGFTTGAWNGGRAMRDWKRGGRPAAPGRLNEVDHLILKPAEVGWRAGRRGVAALLRGDLFREGVDGEAVDWACRRLAGRPEQLKILVVLSDGSPMDSATHLVNGPDLLDEHLAAVVADWQSQVRILGLGVGLDLSPFYRRSQALDLAGDTGNRIFAEIVQLLTGGRSR